MSVPIALAAAAVFSLSGSADTTVAVRPGTSLQIANFAGEILVRAWDRNAVRIRGEAPGGEQILVKRLENVLVIKAYARRAVQHTVDLQITAPAWMDLGVSGIHTDVSIEGARGRVRVETVHGDISVSGGRGQIKLNAVNQDIHLVDASGIVLSETVNGDLTLQRIQSDSVDVSTVNGEIFYEGSIRDRGVYRFASHNGDIAIALPQTANATVNVSTFSGEFASEFPVSLQETKPGRRFCFLLGRGSARVELESFQGAIHIFRPGSRGAVAKLEKGANSSSNMNRNDTPKPPKVKVKANGKGKREYGGEVDEDEAPEPTEERETPEPPEPPEPPDAWEAPEAPEAPEPER